MNNKIISEVLDFWNEQDITTHKLNYNSKFQIKKVLNFVSVDLLKSAIKSYSIILKSDMYFFNYEWSLIDFLKRGLSSQGMSEKKGFWMFMPMSKPFKRFSKNQTVTDPVEALRLKFKPISEFYIQQNILDAGRQTYYGFNIEDIKECTVSKDHVDEKVFRNNDKWIFDDFYTLEKVIAHTLFFRSKVFSLVYFTKLMDAWSEKLPEFKRIARKRLKNMI